MRPVFLVLTLSALLFGSPEAHANALRFDVSVGDAGLQPFYAAVGDYYPAPQREVLVIRERYCIPDEEIPVILFMANRARVSFAAIIDLRQRGESWGGVTRHYGLSPVYYIPMRTGPPYGHAYGHYKHEHWKKWKKHGRHDEDDDD